VFGAGPTAPLPHRRAGVEDDHPQVELGAVEAGDVDRRLGAVAEPQAAPLEERSRQRGSGAGAEWRLSRQVNT
jgi:hypothetical protein